MPSRTHYGWLVAVALATTAGWLFAWQGTDDLRHQTALRQVREAGLEESLVRHEVTLEGLVPPGTIIAYGGKAGDDALKERGWLPCDGTTRRLADWPALYEAIGDAWGPRDVDVFYLPDLNGMFLRGADAKARRDPDVKARTGGDMLTSVGSTQEDAMQDHRHSIHYKAAILHANPPNGHLGGLLNIAAGAPTSTSSPELVPPSTQPVRLSTETRPKNAAVRWLIRGK